MGRVVNRGMSDPQVTAVTSVEVIDILAASRSMPGWRRDPRLVLVGAGLVAIVGFGFAAHVAAPGSSSLRAATGPDGSSLSAGVSRAGVAVPSEAPPVAIDGPTDGRAARGSSVVVTGSSRTSIHAAWFGVRLGGAVFGSQIANIGPEAFRVTILVYAPPVPVAVRLEIRRDGPDGPLLAARPFSLVSRSGVDAWSIDAVPFRGGCRVSAGGPAPLVVRTVDARVVAGGAVLSADEARVDRAADVAVADWLHLGRWAVDLRGPQPSRSGGSPETLRLELAWHDPSDGTSSTLSIPFPSCGPTVGPR
jgi:hypothetical protein